MRLIILNLYFSFSFLGVHGFTCLGAVFSFFPDPVPKPSCRSMYLYRGNLRETEMQGDRVSDESYEYVRQATQASGRVQNLVYEVYLEDGLFSKEQIPDLISEDAARLPSSVVNVLRTDDVTGRAVGTLRMVRSEGTTAFVVVLPWTSEQKIGPSVLPMYADFPEVRGYLDKLGPAVELGRLATTRGADRLATALILVDRALSLLPCCARFTMPDFAAMYKREPDIPILAHATTAENAALYEALGMNKFATASRQGTTHVFFQASAKHMQKKISGDFVEVYQKTLGLPLRKRLIAWQETYNKLTKVQQRTPYALYYRALMKRDGFDYAGAALDLDTFSLKVPDVAEALSFALYFKGLDRLSKISLQASDIVEAKKFGAEIQRVFDLDPGMRKLFKIDFSVALALESGDEAWIREAVTPLMEKHVVGLPFLNPLVEEPAYLSIKAEEDPQKLVQQWDTLRYEQVVKPQKTVSMIYFFLREALAEKLGKTDLSRRYSRSRKLIEQIAVEFYKKLLEQRSRTSP